MPDLPEEAVQAAVEALGARPWNSYPRAAHREHNFDSACAVCRGDVEPIARVILEAAAPILAAQEHAAAVAEIHTIVAEVRAGTAERIAAAILAVAPVEWALAGQHAGRDAARIARQIG